MDKLDIAVIGGGPSGLMSALYAAKKDIDIVVFEEHKNIGKPIQCGEGISANVFQDFPFLSTNAEFVVKEFDYAQIHFPGNHIISGDTNVFMVRRDLFDSHLATLAMQNGAQIKTSAKVTEARIEAEHAFLRVKTNNGFRNFKTKILIIAEGPRAKLARSLNYPSPSLIKALEYRLDGEISDTINFFFDNEKYPMGYCWIFPRAGETNVGIVTTARNRKKRLEKFLEEREIKNQIIKKIGGPIPMEGPSPKLHYKNTLLVGDTAGLTNPLFYGGIRSAMVSGKIAGEIASEKLLDYSNNRYNFDLYEHRLSRYPFMDSINVRCHDFFYSQPNSFLMKLGRIFNNKYINRIEKIDLLKTLGKILLSPSLLSKPKKLYLLYKGFKIARDYGF